MRPARVYAVPYDSGHRATRMGNGPLRLIREVEAPFEMIESSMPFQHEVGTSFELYRKLAQAIRESKKDGELAVVLSGNCGAAVGAAAGVGPDDLAVVWFDAHGDLMTPESTTSGFLDGMGMSVLAGICWKALAGAIPGFKPLDATRLMHAGGRDFSEGEEQHFIDSGIALVRAEPIRERGTGEVTRVLDSIAKLAKRIVVHVDMDVIDPEFGRANNYAAPGGLTPDHIRTVIDHCRARFEIAAIVIASFDPAGDDRGTLAAAARSFVDAARAS